MQRARQLANRLLQMDSAPLTVVPPADIEEIATQESQPAESLEHFSPAALQASWPSPSPATFTISYTPLSISYPDPVNPAASLPTDAVRVTRHELAKMLHQSYVHGSEHGWKPAVKESLQARYITDMHAFFAKFEEQQKPIREQEFNRGFNDGRLQFEAQLASMKERFESEYEKRHLEALEGLAERSQDASDESFSRGFDNGRDAGIREESERHESTRADQADSSTQTEPPQSEQSICVEFSMQTEPPEPEHSFHVDAGMQTKPPAPTFSVTYPELLPTAVVSSDPDLELPFMLPSWTLPCSPHRDSDMSASSISIPVPENHLLSYKFRIITATASSKPHMPDSKPSSHFVSQPPLIFSSSFPSSLSAQPRNVTPFVWSDEPSEVPILSKSPPPSPSAPTISTSFPGRDFSGLRSGANPWQSLQHRQGRGRRRSTQQVSSRKRPSCSSNIYSTIRHTDIPPASFPTTPFRSPLTPPAPLDWEADPRLSELSRVLQTLGWVSPSTSRP